jgi:hypothetical protein
VEAPPPDPKDNLTATDRIQRMKLELTKNLDEGKAKATRALAHVRYVFGYLASGFLVSVPISAASHVIGAGDALSSSVLVETGISIAQGALCLIPFFALVPVTKIDWKNMKVPEYQLFDMKVTRSAMIASGLLCLVSFQVRFFVKWIEPKVYWYVFVLMLFAWARLKAMVLLFPEFYRRDPVVTSEETK